MSRPDDQLLICDLTQSYTPHGGGGISTYLREKRNHLLEKTNHRLLQIVPGPEDRIVESGRSIWVEVGADQVRGSPNYRFIMRTKKVHEILERFRPDVIESLCPWVLPWTAINYRRRNPETALVAGYRTDFPNAHVYRVANDLLGQNIARFARWVTMGYAEMTYREFDRVYTLGEGARAMLGTRNLDRIDVLELGVDISRFDPAKRDPDFRRRLGLPGNGPLLVYAGRIDNEKRADRLIEMMKRLPSSLGAALVMIGDGKLRDTLAAETKGMPIAFTGFTGDRDELAVALASADIYVSAMADETFGVSVVEAQASGLPVVGVASGAMPERVPAGLGLLGPVDDVDQMARNVIEMWQGDHEAVGRAARAHVAARYSWERTFTRLFTDIYPSALARARQRERTVKRGRFGSHSPELLGETA